MFSTCPNKESRKYKEAKYVKQDRVHILGWLSDHSFNVRQISLFFNSVFSLLLDVISTANISPSEDHGMHHGS